MVRPDRKVRFDDKRCTHVARPPSPIFFLFDSSVLFWRDDDDNVLSHHPYRFVYTAEKTDFSFSELRRLQSYDATAQKILASAES